MKIKLITFSAALLLAVGLSTAVYANQTDKEKDKTEATATTEKSADKKGTCEKETAKKACCAKEKSCDKKK